MTKGREDMLSKYQCNDCGSRFKITATSIASAYDHWVPCCPICGTKNDIQKILKE